MVLTVFGETGHTCDVDDEGTVICTMVFGSLEEREEGDCDEVDCSHVCFKNVEPTLEIFVVAEGLFEFVG